MDGFCGFFQGGTEGFNQLVGKMTDKANSVGHYDRPDVRKFQASQRGIQGRKQLIRRVNG